MSKVPKTPAKAFNLAEARARLSWLVRRAEQGEVILIKRYGRGGGQAGPSRSSAPAKADARGLERKGPDCPQHHRDPFDRPLVAQAKVEGLRLLTANHRIARYERFVIPV